MNYLELDTPSLLIDREVMMRNLKKMQDYADRYRVALRPHTKTHKIPALALEQETLGAKGITVSKVGEAQIMAEAGLRDIFIANEIVGEQKLRKIADLSQRVHLSFGLDSVAQARMVEEVFAKCDMTAEVLIEIEVGENRSGIIKEEDFIILLQYLKNTPHIHLKGVFSHDGASYDEPTREAARKGSVEAQKRTLAFAQTALQMGFDISTVSIGSTPSLANESEILEGITEIRPGTYILMDASQGHAVEDMSCCAATVLSTVMSKPTDERVILDVGAKGLTMQKRTKGICATPGLGTIYEFPYTNIDQVYDEHAIIYNKQFHDSVEVGDKVRIIPVHICPVMNLYDQAYLLDEEGNVCDVLDILCRGKMQ